MREIEACEIAHVCPLSTCTDARFATHTRGGIERKEIPSHTVTCMNLKDIMPSEPRQSQKDNYRMTPCV